MLEENNYNQTNIEELLNVYEKLKLGTTERYLEEEDFELLSDYFEDQENLHKALEIINYGINIHLFSSDLLLRKADLLISLENKKQAKEILEQVYILDQLNPGYYILKYEIMVLEHKQKQADDFLENNLHLFSPADRIYILEDIIEVLTEQVEPEAITNYLFQLLKLDNNNDLALIETPFWAQISNKIEECIDINNTIIIKNPYNHLAWFNVGIGYQSLGLFEKSIEAYEYCLAINESFEFGLRNLVSVFIICKQFKKAVEILDSLVTSIERPDHFIFKQLAYCYVGLKKYSLAIKNYQIAQTLDLQNAELLYCIGKLYFKEKNFSEAIDYAKKARSMGFVAINCNSLIGNALYEQKLYKHAMSFLLDVIILKNKNISEWKKVLFCCLQSKRYAQGIDNADYAFNLTNHSIFIFYKVGFLLLNKKTALAKKLFLNNITNNENHFNSVVKVFPILKTTKWAILYLKKKKMTTLKL